MARNYELIIFDWDGTLMDSAGKIVSCFAAAAADVRLRHPGEQAIRRIIGLGLIEAISALFPEQDEETHERVAERYRRHFLHLDSTETSLFPGVEQGLGDLAGHGYLLGIATGKARRGLDRVLEETRTGHLFHVTRCADEALSKPHPRMLEDILVQTGISAGRAVMVGDTVYDLEMAARAGMDSLAVSYGVHDRAELLSHGPLACLDSFEDLCAWLRPESTGRSSAPAKH